MPDLAIQDQEPEVAHLSLAEPSRRSAPWRVSLSRALLLLPGAASRLLRWSLPLSFSRPPSWPFSRPLSLPFSRPPSFSLPMLLLLFLRFLSLLRCLELPSLVASASNHKDCLSAAATIGHNSTIQRPRWHVTLTEMFRGTCRNENLLRQAQQSTSRTCYVP